MEEAKNALTQQKFDASYKAEKSSTKNDTKEEKSDEKPEVAAAFSNAEMRCMCCGKAGHSAKQCRKKDKIPRQDWFINKCARD